MLTQHPFGPGAEPGVRPMISDELRKFADDCHTMALATNNHDWDNLAERWRHCAAYMDRQTAAAKELALRRRKKLELPRKAA